MEYANSISWLLAWLMIQVRSLSELRQTGVYSSGLYLEADIRFIQSTRTRHLAIVIVMPHLAPNQIQGMRPFWQKSCAVIAICIEGWLETQKKSKQ